MTKHFCDKCGKELPPQPYDNVKVGANWLCHGEDSEYSSWKNTSYDICQECAVEIMSFIAGEKVIPEIF